jgi:hypothetical protein
LLTDDLCRPCWCSTRWSRERYDAAQAALVSILRHIDATSADRAVLRPALREEARKAIGDTGLLDHLLKHAADTRVSGAGDCLRRRHNRWVRTGARPAAKRGLRKRRERRGRAR